jgi:hypothetical protein
MRQTRRESYRIGREGGRETGGLGLYRPPPPKRAWVKTQSASPVSTLSEHRISAADVAVAGLIGCYFEVQPEISVFNSIRAKNFPEGAANGRKKKTSSRRFGPFQ